MFVSMERKWSGKKGEGEKTLSLFGNPLKMWWKERI